MCGFGARTEEHEEKPEHADARRYAGRHEERATFVGRELVPQLARKARLIDWRANASRAPLRRRRAGAGAPRILAGRHVLAPPVRLTCNEIFLKPASRAVCMIRDKRS